MTAWCYFTGSQSDGLRQSGCAPEQLDREVEQLAADVAAMPSVPVVITKEHVNAIARALASVTKSGDGDALLGAITDPESVQARKDYTERRLRKQK